MTEIEHLFVYGTLRRGFGHPMHRVIDTGTTAIGEALAPGTLYDLGPYPGLWLGTGGPPNVRGEVYQLRPGSAADTLARLDAYEGIRAGEVGGCAYRRELVGVRCDNGTLPAWTYVLTAMPPGAVPVPGGDYLAWVASR